MTDDIDTDKPASEQFGLSTDTDEDILNPDALHRIARELERVSDSAMVDCYDDETLAELTAAVKRLENAAEDARKDGYEDALDDRVEDGETVGPVRKQSGSSTYVTDAEGAFAAVSDAGEDPLSVADVKVGDLRDVLGNEADEYLGSSSYSYFVRQG